ncbi:MAG: PIG-L deacetylase family protein [Dehalococcoidia bacterium]|nr:PIG-L deacetylase family protein [Dehalococcoidia bacterium]
MIDSILVVSPHPDDAEFGAAGTIAKWRGEGRDIYLVVCTNGDKGSNDPKMTSTKLAATRHEEQEAAAKVLSIKRVVFLDYPDGGLEDTPEFRGKLVRLIRLFRPGIVAAPDPYRRYLSHRDHRIGGMVALDAVFPYARDRLSYPEHAASGLEPHKVREVYLWRSETPNLHVDIRDTFEQKLNALLCHRSQVGSDASAVEARIRQRAADLGGEKGIALAEAFYRLELPL